MNKHYWKRNEIIYLGELVTKYTGALLTHWSKVEEDFNSKYCYELTIDELKKAYDTYYGGKKNGRTRK